MDENSIVCSLPLEHGAYRWLSARLQYLHCMNNGDIAVLHYAINISLAPTRCGCIWFDAVRRKPLREAMLAKFCDDILTVWNKTAVSPGARFNMNISSQYKNSHYRGKTISRLSYLYNAWGIRHEYWNGAPCHFCVPLGFLIWQAMGLLSQASSHWRWRTASGAEALMKPTAVCGSPLSVGQPLASSHRTQVLLASPCQRQIHGPLEGESGSGRRPSGIGTGNL